MTSQLLIVDNYDSFTFNLVQALGAFGARVEVVRNDAVDVATICSDPPRALVLSPGPGRPQSAGASLALVRALSGRLPILGVCLGHQAIGAAFGARIIPAPEVVHGKTCRVVHEGGPLFAGVPSPFRAARYHSLVIDETDLAASPLEVIARSPEGLMMAIRHREHPTYGVQFHPESILTRHGPRLLSNFLSLARATP